LNGLQHEPENKHVRVVKCHYSKQVDNINREKPPAVVFHKAPLILENSFYELTSENLRFVEVLNGLVENDRLIGARYKMHFTESVADLDRLISFIARVVYFEKL
tara:strand:+ start:429 stop:740 length:312 start_codon:yes stop_codon:yes gene_type:complete